MIKVLISEVAFSLLCASAADDDRQTQGGVRQHDGRYLVEFDAEVFMHLLKKAPVDVTDALLVVLRENGKL